MQMKKDWKKTLENNPKMQIKQSEIKQAEMLKYLQISGCV